jgi:hypothetical protein
VVHQRSNAMEVKGGRKSFKKGVVKNTKLALKASVKV